MTLPWILTSLMNSQLLRFASDTPWYRTYYRTGTSPLIRMEIFRLKMWESCIRGKNWVMWYIETARTCRWTRVQLTEMFQGLEKPAVTYRGPLASTGISSVDSLMTGTSDVGSERIDSFFSVTIRDHLFSAGGRTPGMDLPALNIQRGREHGIPGVT